MLRSKLGNKYPTWKYFIVKKCIALRLCLLNRRNAQGCARSKGKACVSESSDGKDKYRKGDSTGGDKENFCYGQYKKTAKIVLAQIRNIVAGMDPEEKDEVYEDIF